MECRPKKGKIENKKRPDTSFVYYDTGGPVSYIFKTQQSRRKESQPLRPNNIITPLQLHCSVLLPLLVYALLSH